MNWLAFITGYVFCYVVTMLIEHAIERRVPRWVYAFVALTSLLPGITTGVVFR